MSNTSNFLNVKICKNTYLDNNFEGYNVNLPHIYEKLILSDFIYSSKNINNNVVIINLCEKPLISLHNPHIYNIQINDSNNVPYEYFKMIMLKCYKILKMAENNNYPVIVNCAAGINRSSSVIITYSFLYKKFSIKQIINYIKYIKFKKYGDMWPTLTNHKFIEYLLIMQSELFN